MNHNIVVLAMAPNGGKTEVSIDVIRRYLKDHPKAKVLVITHSTIVLKKNYINRLSELEEPPFLWSAYATSPNDPPFNPKAQVHIFLRQNANEIRGHYDLVVVDEAHENYFASQMKTIIRNTSPKKQLLLTGTPSVFIAKKDPRFKIYPIAANDIPEQYFAKLQIELVASAYPFKKYLNQDGEIRDDFQFTRRQTEITLENVVEKLIERVRYGLPPEEFNRPGVLTALKKSYSKVFEKLKKTIIVCRSVEQADDVYRILDERGVKSLRSHYQDDRDSQAITQFKYGKDAAGKKYKVLVVVNRTRLGYSDTDLYNIIDMSGSHNPNRIYQLFARVLRGDPSMQKYYLKVTSQEPGMMDYMHVWVCAALMLTDRKHLETFNGRNFNAMTIPIVRKPNKPPKPVPPDDPHRKRNRKPVVFPEFTYDVIGFFKNVIHNLDSPASIYKATTIGEVKRRLNGQKVWTREAIIESAMGLT